MRLCPDISGSKERQRARFQGEPRGAVGRHERAMGRCGGATERCVEMGGDVGSIGTCGEVWGTMGRCGEI